MILVVAAASCQRGAPSRAVPVDASPSAAAAPVPLFFAGRCGECHGKMYAEWQRSAHARAGRSLGYLAARKQTSEAAACERCHSPLGGLAAADNPVAKEGVTCEACHILAGVTVGKKDAQLILRANDNVKYGPLCDAKSHYFHKMGCSPLHTESKLCAGCHLWYRGDLPVFTEYEEWQKSALADAGVECQSCHMPSDRAAVAEGGQVRASVPHHGFMGRAGKMLVGSVELGLRCTGDGGLVAVTATLIAKHTGHRVPTGAPEHRLVLSLRVVDRAGQTRDSTERSFGRVLADDTGAPAQFWRATKLVRDDRLVSDEPRVERWSAHVRGAHEVVATLFYYETARELLPATAPRPTPVVVAERHVSVERHN